MFPKTCFPLWLFSRRFTMSTAENWMHLLHGFIITSAELMSPSENKIFETYKNWDLCPQFRNMLCFVPVALLDSLCQVSILIEYHQSADFITDFQIYFFPGLSLLGVPGKYPFWFVPAVPAGIHNQTIPKWSQPFGFRYCMGITCFFKILLLFLRVQNFAKFCIFVHNCASHNRTFACAKFPPVLSATNIHTSPYLHTFTQTSHSTLPLPAFWWFLPLGFFLGARAFCVGRSPRVN